MYLNIVDSIFLYCKKCDFFNVICNSIARVRPGIECKVCRMYVHSKCQIYVPYCSGVSIFHYKIFLLDWDTCTCSYNMLCNSQC